MLFGSKVERKREKRERERDGEANACTGCRAKKNHIMIIAIFITKLEFNMTCILRM